MRLIDADALVKCVNKIFGLKPDARWSHGDVLNTIDAAPTIGEWISVEDRLPEQSGYVLTCYGDYHTINVFSYSKKHRAFNAHDCLPTAENNVDVTHWMPLPEPPEEVAKAE
jgi:hypothetical protein